MGSRGPAPGVSKGTLQFRDGVPSPPDWLDTEAQAEYNRAAEELLAAGAGLQQVDFAILCAYAQAYADMARLCVRIREEGEVVDGAGGAPIANPLIRSRSLALQTLRTTSQKLGFSPADRARVPSKNVAAKDEFSEFVK